MGGWGLEVGGNAEELRRAGGEVGCVEVALEVGEIRSLRDERGEGGGVDARDDPRAGGGNLSIQRAPSNSTQIFFPFAPL
jgi:hypothetical protein